MLLTKLHTVLQFGLDCNPVLCIYKVANNVNFGIKRCYGTKKKGNFNWDSIWRSLDQESLSYSAGLTCVSLGILKLIFVHVPLHYLDSDDSPRINRAWLFESKSLTSICQASPILKMKTSRRELGLLIPQGTFILPPPRPHQSLNWSSRRTVGLGEYACVSLDAS